MTLGPTTTRISDELDELVEHAVGETSRTILGRLRSELDEPLRLAVTGRVNAGKSTLVNALLRQRIAPTDVSECTRYASWFRFGTPERVEVVGPDGTRRPVRLRNDGRLPASLGDLSDLDVARIDVFLSNDTLRDLTLIDTPGLASSREDVQTTAEVLALDRRSRVALAEADAMLFVVGGALRTDEHELLDEFRRLTSGLGPTSINTLAVVSRVDHAVDVATNPVEAALPRCRRLATELRANVSHVLPVVGLLAETADSGALTDTDLFAVAQMTTDRDRFTRALRSVDRFTQTDLPGTSEADRHRLLDLLDLHGLRMAADELHAGGTASAVVDTLRARSGIGALRVALRSDITAHADLLKASWAIGGLHELAYRVDPADRESVLDLAERLELAPELHRVAEIGVLRELAAGHSDLATVDIEEVRSLVEGRTPAARLGLDPNDPGDDELRTVAIEAANRWRARGNDGSASPSLRSVAAVLSRSYELIAEHVRTEAS